MLSSRRKARRYKARSRDGVKPKGCTHKNLTHSDTQMRSAMINGTTHYIAPVCVCVFMRAGELG